MQMTWFYVGSWNMTCWPMGEHFVLVCRKGLKINSDKNKMMVLNGEEGLECESSCEWDAIGACVRS